MGARVAVMKAEEAVITSLPQPAKSNADARMPGTIFLFTGSIVSKT